jgi:hypothetical protein
MIKRLLITGLGFLGIAFLVWATVGVSGSGEALAAQRGRGNDGPPPPCGPAGDLPADLSANVAADSRCFELRFYTVDPSRDGVGNFKGGINELHQRFREREVVLFENNGAEVLAVWQDLGNPLTLVYMLAFRDREHRDQVWAAFNADPEWTELRTKYFVPLGAEVHMLSAADYSPLK